MNEHQARQYQKKTLMMITTTFRTKEIPAFGDPGRHTLYSYIATVAKPVRFPPSCKGIINAPACMQVRKIINRGQSPLDPSRLTPSALSRGIRPQGPESCTCPECSLARGFGGPVHRRPSEVAARRQGFRLSLRTASNNNQASRFDTLGRHAPHTAGKNPPFS